MTVAPGADEDVAGRIVLVVDVELTPAARETCGDMAAGLAGRTGVPVTMVEAPIGHLDRLRPGLTEGDTRVREFQPAPRREGPATMSSAPFLWRDDGRPDWAGMWTTFCELALYGGPPHRGPDSAIRPPAVPADPVDADADTIVEIRRGIWETTGLYAEPAAAGWLAVSCGSSRMAAWLCAAIILENVEARLEEDRLLVPVAPGYRLKDEVKSIITVIAKTHHYWTTHITAEGRDATGGA